MCYRLIAWGNYEASYRQKAGTSHNIGNSFGNFQWLCRWAFEAVIRRGRDRFISEVISPYFYYMYSRGCSGDFVRISFPTQVFRHLSASDRFRATLSGVSYRDSMKHKTLKLDWTRGKDTAKLGFSKERVFLWDIQTNLRLWEIQSLNLEMTYFAPNKKRSWSSLWGHFGPIGNRF